MKNLVISCDGTWNTPDQRDRGIPDPTNVVLLSTAVAAQNNAHVRQEKYYHPGVGTNGTELGKLIGGGTGRGLDLNIMSAYEWLCQHYSADDQIYLFGFSRGAYTVRSLCGLIGCAGLLDLSGVTVEAEIWQRVERIFQNGYRRKTERPNVWRDLGWRFRSGDGQGRIPIRFVGVWDTVGALGIPDDMAVLNMLDRLHDYTFHDTDLSPTVATARHAVALDEMRASFQPTMWTQVENRDVKQVWFPGVHSDVGGGYLEAGLSHGALQWMIGEAQQCGLGFDPRYVSQITPDAHGVLHDSADGAFGLLPTQPRSVPQMMAGAAVHSSALERQAAPPINQSPYRQDRPLDAGAPAQLEVFARQSWNPTGLWLQAGREYTFAAAGEWLDSHVKCGPAGCSDGHFQLGEVAQFAGTVLGKAETLFRQLTGNQSADFRFTKRHEDMPWFCLVGAIANGTGVDAKGHLQPHETFAIGNGCVYTPRSSGYFYAYANDAWNCYGNNRGSVALSVTLQ